MKISKTSSDIRKSLFILQESILRFIAMKKTGETNESRISMNILASVYQDLYKDPLMKSLRELPHIQKTVLARLIDLIK